MINPPDSADIKYSGTILRIFAWNPPQIGWWYSPLIDLLYYENEMKATKTEHIFGQMLPDTRSIPLSAWKCLRLRCKRKHYMENTMRMHKNGHKLRNRLEKTCNLPIIDYKWKHTHEYKQFIHIPEHHWWKIIFLWTIGHYLWIW